MRDTACEIAAPSGQDCCRERSDAYAYILTQVRKAIAKSSLLQLAEAPARRTLHAHRLLLNSLQQPWAARQDLVAGQAVSHGGSALLTAAFNTSNLIWEDGLEGLENVAAMVAQPGRPRASSSQGAARLDTQLDVSTQRAWLCRWRQIDDCASTAGVCAQVSVADLVRGVRVTITPELAKHFTITSAEVSSLQQAVLPEFQRALVLHLQHHFGCQTETLRCALMPPASDLLYRWQSRYLPTTGTLDMRMLLLSEKLT